MTALQPLRIRNNYPVRRVSFFFLLGTLCFGFPFLDTHTCEPRARTHPDHEEVGVSHFATVFNQKHRFSTLFNAQISLLWFLLRVTLCAMCAKPTNWYSIIFLSAIDFFFLHGACATDLGCYHNGPHILLLLSKRLYLRTSLPLKRGSSVHDFGNVCIRRVCKHDFALCVA